MIYFIALIVGWIAGVLAVWSVCAFRGKSDRWKRQMFYSAPIWMLPIFAVHRLGWYALFAAFATYGLVFLALWMDSRKKLPR
jgi:hypothetical protein